MTGLSQGSRFSTVLSGRLGLVVRKATIPDGGMARRRNSSSWILLGLITTKSKEEMMYKLAVAILLLSAPAFAQDKNEPRPNMPPTNLKNTVIPKSGGEQSPANTPTTAAQANRPDTTATRPAKEGPQQTSVPNAAPPATITQTTGASNQDPKIKAMNEEEKQKVEKEGK
jgi:hypothetical protein